MAIKSILSVITIGVLAIGISSISFAETVRTGDVVTISFDLSGDPGVVIPPGRVEYFIRFHTFPASHDDEIFNLGESFTITWFENEGDTQGIQTDSWAASFDVYTIANPCFAEGFNDAAGAFALSDIVGTFEIQSIMMRTLTGGIFSPYVEQTFVVSRANSEPVADAGPDQEVQCTGNFTSVVLNGTASSDPDNDTLGFEWSLPEYSEATIDDPFSATPTGQFPLGPTLVTLTVTDGNGGVDCDDVLITIFDDIPPVLLATTDKIALWPPNHEVQQVLVTVEVTDCAWDTSTTLTALVASSEPDDGLGDGSYINDVNGQDGFTFPVAMVLSYIGESEPGVYVYQGAASLRAERDGSERSRVYSFVCDVGDVAGNTSTASCVVVVPHDRRNK